MTANMQKIIEGAAKGGWDWFEQADPEIQKRLGLVQEKESDDSKAIAHAWAHFAATPGGAKALQALFDRTLNRTVFFVQLGLDIQSMAVFGAFREGQNALAHEIARQIALGMNDDQPKPRDVT
ncbi:hypothetical protein LJR231_002260 [Phyllobacterium sp. LjRoot231]|uniref:hypothetical protein n=1 Tax=Phyllobacterium sp. LjRoot231 TaxID=3342289 RepID=UPI003ECFDC18